MARETPAGITVRPFLELLAQRSYAACAAA